MSGNTPSVPGVNTFLYLLHIYETLCGVVVLHRSMLDWRRGGGVSLPWVYVHSAIYETCLV